MNTGIINISHFWFLVSFDSPSGDKPSDAALVNYYTHIVGFDSIRKQRWLSSAFEGTIWSFNLIEVNVKYYLQGMDLLTYTGKTIHNKSVKAAYLGVTKGRFE